MGDVKKSLSQFKEPGEQSLGRKRSKIRNKEVRQTQNPAQLESVFKINRRESSQKAKQKNNKVNFEEEGIDGSHPSVNTCKSQQKQESKSSQDQNLGGSKTSKQSKNLPKMKSRTKKKLALTDDHLHMIEQSQEIERVMDKVVAQGSVSLSKSEMELYRRVSDWKLTSFIPKKEEKQKKRKIKNVGLSQPISTKINEENIEDEDDAEKSLVIDIAKSKVWDILKSVQNKTEDIQD